jgi:chromosomal replication initiator protein
VELTAVEVWSRIRDAVREHLPDHAYSTWVASAEAVALTAQELVIEARNPFHAEWLEDKYGPLLTEHAALVLGRPIQISVTAAPTPAEGALPSIRLDPPRSQAPVAPPSTGAHAGARQGESSRPAATAPSLDPGLFGRYTFERFVVGGNNQLAEAACRAVADSPGRLYNPLFLYGGVGLGKTHLMHAIGHSVLNSDEYRRVAYVSSEQFTNELIQAIRRGTTEEFRGRYRQIDLLLVDDVHFLKGKESTQEEFFHTFNTLYDAQRQIVVTSDRPPRDMEGVEQRLVSRFEWGLVVDLRPPDFETRMAILRAKADDEGLVLDDDVIEYIAHSCSSSVRELEGAVLKLLAVSSVWNQEITFEFAKRVLALRRREQQARAPIASPDRITRCVAQSWRVRPDSLQSKARTRNVTEARHVAMFAIRELLGTPLTEIGSLFGGRDHSTVLYSIRKVQGRMVDDSDFRKRVDDVLAELRETSGLSYPD